MSAILRRLVVAVLVVGLPFLPARAAGAEEARTLAESGAMAYAVTTQGELVLLGLEDPYADPLEQAPITGLRDGDVVRSIDVNPVDGTLTAVAGGPDGGTRTYAVETDPAGFGVAVEIAADGPVDDLDIDPCTGTPTDAPARVFPPGDPSAGAATPDGFAKLPAVRLLGGALCTTRTFVVDATRDVLATDVPSAPGLLRTVGSLGQDLGAVRGFDIDAGPTGLLATSEPAATEPVAEVAPTRAAPSVSITLLFWVDLGTGRLTPIGSLLFGVLAVALAILGLLLPPVPQAPLLVVVPALLLAGGAVELLRSRRRRAERARPALPTL